MRRWRRGRSRRIKPYKALLVQDLALSAFVVKIISRIRGKESVANNNKYNNNNHNS